MKKSILFLIIILLLMSSCNYSRFKITSVSMSPNLGIDDIIIVDKKEKATSYGDLVAFLQPSDEIIVGRIVGLPLDSISVDKDICIINGKKNKFREIEKAWTYSYDFPFDKYEEVFPNGERVLILTCPTCMLEGYGFSTILVPENHFFMLGDNRSNSYDSRFFGPISDDQIIGKVIKIIKTEK